MLRRTISSRQLSFSAIFSIRQDYRLGYFIDIIGLKWWRSSRVGHFDSIHCQDLYDIIIIATRIIPANNMPSRWKRKNPSVTLFRLASHSHYTSTRAFSPSISSLGLLWRLLESLVKSYNTKSSLRPTRICHQPLVFHSGILYFFTNEIIWKMQLILIGFFLKRVNIFLLIKYHCGGSESKFYVSPLECHSMIYDFFSHFFNALFNVNHRLAFPSCSVSLNPHFFFWLWPSVW